MALHRGEQMKKKFECVQGCSDCCIYRDYYPSIEYGKIGVLVLPEEKAAIERLANNIGVKVRIIPRLAVGKNSPEKVIAYQMMGKNEDGDLCPFLDVESNERSAHGGFKCKIYSDRLVVIHIASFARNSRPRKLAAKACSRKLKHLPRSEHV